MPTYALFLGLFVALALTMAGDTLVRRHFKMADFRITKLISWWFIGYLMMKLTAIGIWVFLVSQYQIGRLVAMYGISSLLLNNVVGLFFLKEVLKPVQYVGLALAVIALALLSL